MSLADTAVIEAQHERAITHRRRVLRWRRYALVAGPLLFAAMVGYIVWATHVIETTTSTNHNLTQEVLAKDNEILAVLKEHTITLADIKTLQSEVVGIVDQLPVFKAALTGGQNALISQYNTIATELNAVCADFHLVGCGGVALIPLQPVPAVPVATTTTSRPATTTTTTLPFIRPVPPLPMPPGLVVPPAATTTTTTATTTTTNKPGRGPPLGKGPKNRLTSP